MRRQILHSLNLVSGVASFIVVVLLAIELSFIVSVANRALFIQFHKFLIIYFLIDLFCRFCLNRRRKILFVTRILDWLLLLPVVGMLVPEFSFLNHYFLVQIVLLAVVVGRYGHVNDVFRFFRFNPAQIFVIGFVMAIFIGALLLSLPVSHQGTVSLSWIDAVFTATSAICVTGLTTQSTGQYFSEFGQAVILVLIQIGGLGIMTFYALITMFLNRKFTQKESTEYQETLQIGGVKETVGLIKSIIKFTLLFELLGMGVLFLFWYPQFSSPLEALYYSLFHSVSAFCNAGFSLFSDSLIGFASHPGIILTFSCLIIFGGIGFPVIFDLNRRFSSLKEIRRLRLQTKLPIIFTLVLLAVGTAVIFFGEYNAALSGLSMPDKFLMSFFHSVSARTAGFHAMAISSFQTGTLWILVFLMFIGASPGSTGGGIKTTTFALLLISLWETVQARPRIEVFGRTITTDNILKALSMMTISVIIIVLAFYGLLMTESISFFPLLFEAISAFATVGFSLDVTSTLSEMGKWWIISLMFLGRVGPLTIAFSLARRRPHANYNYPEEKILLG